MPSGGEQAYDLTVRGDAVERLYGQYTDQKLLVNRRYQRKLVWTLEEKQKFIDSLMYGYPVPLILLAESRRGDRTVYEIIDGMQRLNAVMSFLENEFSVHGQYFNLDTMAETKARLDAGELAQREPKMDRDTCVKIASYTVPLSIYESSEAQRVDEVFRRINSGGRKLSRQELRAAGSTGHFANLVSLLASRVRGDASARAELTLNNMKLISIGNRELPYGIDVEQLFWVREGILTKEQVRESRDEELIADVLAFLLVDPPPSSRSEFLDDYFGLGQAEVSEQRLNEVDLAVQRHTQENLSSDFLRVLDELKLVLNASGKTFGQLLFESQPSRAPRYFQVVFLALYQLLVTENMEISDYRQLADIMDGAGSEIPITEGGRWGARERTNAVNGAAGMFRPAVRAANVYDPARVRWIGSLETLLMQSYTEQATYDFKQGFLHLDGSNTIDEDSVDKILRTLVGIANIDRDTKGYVLVGIADQAGTARRVHDLFGVTARPYERFYITGVEHEAVAMGKDLDQLFHWITSRITQSAISEPLKGYVAGHVKVVRYYDKSVVILETRGQEHPSHYSGVHVTRQGNSLVVIPPEKYGELYARYLSGR